MRACSTASGGVMFIPDTIARKKCKVSYKTLLESESEDAPAAKIQNAKKPRFSFFGRRKAEQDRDIRAA